MFSLHKHNKFNSAISDGLLFYCLYVLRHQTFFYLSVEPVELRIIGDESLTFDQNEVMFSLEVECRTADDEVTTGNIFCICR